MPQQGRYNTKMRNRTVKGEQTNNSARSQSAGAAQSRGNSDQIDIQLFKQININGMMGSVRLDSYTSVSASPNPKRKDQGSSTAEGIPFKSLATLQRPSSMPNPIVTEWVPVIYESVEFFPKATQAEHRAKQKELITQPVYESFPHPFRHVRQLAGGPPVLSETIVIDTAPYQQGPAGPIILPMLTPTGASALCTEGTQGLSNEQQIPEATTPITKGLQPESKNMTPTATVEPSTKNLPRTQSQDSTTYTDDSNSPHRELRQLSVFPSESLLPPATFIGPIPAITICDAILIPTTSDATTQPHQAKNEVPLNNMSSSNVSRDSNMQPQQTLGSPSLTVPANVPPGLINPHELPLSPPPKSPEMLPNQSVQLPLVSLDPILFITIPGNVPHEPHGTIPGTGWYEYHVVEDIALKTPGIIPSSLDYFTPFIFDNNTIPAVFQPPRRVSYQARKSIQPNRRSKLARGESVVVQADPKKPFYTSRITRTQPAAIRRISTDQYPVYGSERVDQNQQLDPTDEEQVSKTQADYIPKGASSTYSEEPIRLRSKTSFDPGHNTAEFVYYLIPQPLDYLYGLLEQPCLYYQIPDTNAPGWHTSVRQVMAYATVDAEQVPGEAVLLQFTWMYEPQWPLHPDCPQYDITSNWLRSYIPCVEWAILVYSHPTTQESVLLKIPGPTLSTGTDVPSYQEGENPIVDSSTKGHPHHRATRARLSIPIPNLTIVDDGNDHSENAKSDPAQYIPSSTQANRDDLEEDKTLSTTPDSLHSSGQALFPQSTEKAEPMSSVGLLRIKPTKTAGASESRITQEQPEIYDAVHFNQLSYGSESRPPESDSESVRLQTPPRLETSGTGSDSLVPQSPKVEHTQSIPKPKDQTSQVRVTTERVNRFTSWGWDREHRSPNAPTSLITEKGTMSMKDAYELRREVSLTTTGMSPVFPLGEQPSITINLPKQAGVRYEMDFGDKHGIKVGINAYTINDDWKEKGTQANGEGGPMTSCFPRPRIRKRKVTSSMR